MINYGDCYKNGNGTKQDFKKAYRVYTQAAHLGNPYAYANLGYLSQAGQGTKKDIVEAAFWFTLSSRDGNEDAQRSSSLKSPPSSRTTRSKIWRSASMNGPAGASGDFAGAANYKACCVPHCRT